MVFVLFRSVRLAKSSVNQSLSGPQDQAPCASEKARKREVTAMPHEVLRKILPVVGWSEDQAAAVAFTGGSDPVLPTPFRIGLAGAATVAAAGLGAAGLWQARTGRRQQITVDLHQATASLRSGHYMKLGEGHLSPKRNDIMGCYRTRDGRWSYLHCNFPNHRAAALGVLGVAEDRSAVAAAVAKWDAADLEEAIIAAKGAGGMVRTQAEWKQHPQAAAIAALPLMEIVRIGDSPPEKLPAGDRPLAGIRVLDLTRVLAGPTCARTLAEHGADVMKISAAHLPNLGYQEWDTGHGKLSAQLDLRQAADLETLRGLVRETDVFSQGYRPGSLAGRGLAPEELAALRPGLVYVSLSAFGHSGPWAGRQLAGPHLARPGRQVDGRSWRSAHRVARARAGRVRRSRARQLVDREPDAVRAAAPSQARRADVGD
jgi:crotonobetainyl-CoA:carnitine CoA-transferase CaiB-like acyl-CoA transferase